MQITKLEELDIIIDALNELYCTFHNNNCGDAESQWGNEYMEAINKLHARVTNEYIKRSEKDAV